MKRIILKKVLKQLNIKQSSEKNKNEKTVATTLNLNGKVVNCKINNISLNNYVQDLTNIELTAIIDNLIKEKIYVDDKDQFANQISANIAEEILKLISNNNCCINSICPDVYGLYNEGKYYDFIINSLFLEQNPPLITDIKIFNNPISIEAGSSYKIIAQIKPKNTINTNIKWKSSNTEIVDIEMCNPPYIINLSCIIKAKSIGKANITVSTEDDTIIDCCEINVITPDKDNKTVNVPSNIFNKNINNKKETVYKGLLCGVILLIALMLIYNYCTYNNKISKTNIFKIEDISPENTSLPLNQQQIFKKSDAGNIPKLGNLSINDSEGNIKINCNSWAKIEITSENCTYLLIAVRKISDSDGNRLIYPTIDWSDRIYTNSQPYNLCQSHLFSEPGIYEVYLRGWKTPEPGTPEANVYKNVASNILKIEVSKS